MGKPAFILAALCAAAFSMPAHADITGTIDATITLTTACRINNAVVPDTTTGVDFGTIDFGTQNSYFTTADAQLVGTVGNGIAIQCSDGIEPTIAFSGGSFAGLGSSNTGTTGARAMKHTADANYVTYNLYEDVAGGTAIPVDGTIVLASDGSVQTVPIFGRAFGANSLVTGTYSDVVVVTVSFNP
ncbi:spore coat U domain-containing protein [Sphingobium sp. BYY-5]|uniref:Csu type fimbrial protein n=1 Tax=Sphingobium sp. BYY-5 TaxID=2926400 RepID=UPI001FA77AA9|nr:spore coat U domain-containing protein [Sphingobium sp. BYY-5]MCI4590290.1 spore coat U domain-containing protein [Sphingobium sp. BYY-5]